MYKNTNKNIEMQIKKDKLSYSLNLEQSHSSLVLNEIKFGARSALNIKESRHDENFP